MGKLVRDRIPERFGGRCHTLSPADDRAALRDRLQEVVAEYLHSGEVVKLADVLDVVYALAELDGVSGSGLDRLRERKAASAGRSGIACGGRPPNAR